MITYSFAVKEPCWHGKGGGKGERGRGRGRGKGFSDGAALRRWADFLSISREKGEKERGEEGENREIKNVIDGKYRGRGCHCWCVCISSLAKKGGGGEGGRGREE